MELSSLLAIVLGTYGSLKFSDITHDWLSINFSSQIESIDENYLKVASFAGVREAAAVNKAVPSPASSAL